MSDFNVTNYNNIALLWYIYPINLWSWALSELYLIHPNNPFLPNAALTLKRQLHLQDQYPFINPLSRSSYLYSNTVTNIVIFYSLSEGSKYESQLCLRQAATAQHVLFRFGRMFSWPFIISIWKAYLFSEYIWSRLESFVDIFQKIFTWDSNIRNIYRNAFHLMGFDGDFIENLWKLCVKVW